MTHDERDCDLCDVLADFLHGITCIHQPAGECGLCEQCAEDYAVDPTAWLEYGDHPAGIANAQREWDLIEGDRIEHEFRESVYDDENIPF